ncbi:transcription termination factor MTEF1 [Cucumis melo var. makuwa]|uniref:Transcription termination factor MTEF1 n=1 Tax=Cucumis melo var. makuwa TaxID=1194695 RepID=A0A5A7U135_CUCMM|nr:transcription termination factor MTEF1 [Cucumis melo var. makuwa]TYK16162.1 transcription termination factor MTEF1 [Cucumis melo var. makuwa]
MSYLFRRILLLRSPSSVFSHGFSGCPLKSLRFLSTSSEIVSSPKSASLASNAALVALLANHGFSESQISDIAKRQCKILSLNPQKILSPKLLFFQSKGLSSPEIVKLVCSIPCVLTGSLNKRIIPNFDYLQAVLGSEEKTLATIKKFAGILIKDLRISVGPNIEILKQIGVQDSNILKYLQYQPRMFLINSIRFKEVVERVTEMGFNPDRLQFVVAVFALRSMTKSTWDKKVEVYRKWGLSEEEFSIAFRRNPLCMAFSEDKINAFLPSSSQQGTNTSLFLLLPLLTLMSNLFRRILLLRSPSPVFSQGFSESPLKSLRYLSTSSEIVSSPTSAPLASNAVQLKNKRKDAIALLSNHGFSESQISDLDKKYPQILSANPEKTLLPKLLFLESKAVFGSEEKTLITIKRFAGILVWDLRISVGPNIEILKQIGVPDSNILKYLQRQPRSFLINSIRFKETVERVTEMGFNPQQMLFVFALFGLRGMTKSTWDKKVEVYRKWGLSEEEIRLAF